MVYLSSGKIDRNFINISLYKLKISQRILSVSILANYYIVLTLTNISTSSFPGF